VGIPNILIDVPEEIPEAFLKWVGNIWISSWASVPDSLVRDVIKHLESHWGVFEKEIITKEEKMIFPYKLDLQ
jgi:4-hydroxy-3-methylbut-2-enyl diphosphate reductase IspH